jgi:cyclophilin family peptidyl-prolyl cis-trans isomerase
MKIVNYSILILLATLITVAACKKNEEADENPCTQVILLNLGNDTVLTDQLSFILDAGNQGAAYEWSTGETTQTIEINQSAIYWVKVSACGNTVTDSIDIMFCYTVNANLGLDIMVTDPDTIKLNAGNPHAEFLWSTGETTQIINVTSEGTYWVRITSCQYTDADTINIVFNYSTIKIQTDFGDFRIWLYDQTPLHKSNFLELTTLGFYDQLIYHRVVYDFVIQGGDPEGTGYGGPGYTIPAEIIPGLNHHYGAVGAARQADYYNPEKESNGSQYYIVCDPDGEPGLNGDYTVFGTVFYGMETVIEISQVPVDTNNRPITDVLMNSVTIEVFTTEELQNNFGFEIPE